MSECSHTKNRRVYKLPPCPAYDIEEMESWLGDMAREGLLLCRDGFFAGFAAFEKSEPCNMRYRLDAAPKNTGMWADGGGSPDEDAVAAGEYFGWEYVASRGQFYIYRAKNAGSRELNTDARVQALAINEVRKRERATVVTCFFWAFIYPLILLKGGLLAMLNYGTWFVLYGMSLLIWFFAEALARAVHLGRLRKKLMAEGTLDHRKSWKRKATPHQIANLLLAVLVIFWLGALFQHWSDSILNVGRTPLDEYSGKMPFATIADFAPEGEYEADSYFDTANTVKIWDDWLAPAAIDWNESATVTLRDDKALSGVLKVNYYETAAPWLAREVVREYLREDKYNKRCEKLSLPELDVDYATAYLNSYHFPTLIIQNENKVMRVMFVQTSSSYELAIDDWARVTADSITS